MLTAGPDAVSCRDNAWAYARSRLFRGLLTRHRIRHLKTKPYRPRTNGVERFHQTMAREWAYSLVYQSHHERARALPHWLEHYNTRRPHSSLAGRPPISRVHNLCGQDIWPRLDAKCSQTVQAVLGGPRRATRLPIPSLTKEGVSIAPAEATPTAGLQGLF
jgi:hypothetical protein